MSEVHEDVQREKILQLWQKYGRMCLIAIAVVSVVAISWGLWTAHQTRQQVAFTHQYEKMLELLASGQTSEALEHLTNLQKNSNAGYRILSSLIKSNVSSTPRQELEAMIENTKIEPQFRDLARCILACSDLSGEHAYTITPRIESVINSNSPWRALAMEIRAQLLAQQQQNKDAFNIFQNLAQDALAPQGVQLRAQAYMQIIANP